MDFLELKSNYANTESINDTLHEEFTKKTNETSWLLNHRVFIENNQLGFGDRAFHYMWYLLLQNLKGEIVNRKINLLEIGVFKGQVISLWSIISQRFNINTSIYAISPLKGNPRPNNEFIYKVKMLLSRKFRKLHASANFYENENYFQIIEQLFKEFDLDINTIEFNKGFSTDSEIIDKLQSKKFDLVYIDGDHTYDGVVADLNNYTPLIAQNGYLVMDDASNNIPGTKFWKGHQDVANACEIIPSLGFKNIFNIGHNRVYQKV